MYKNNEFSSAEDITKLCEATNNLDAVMTILNINTNEFPSETRELLKAFEGLQHGGGSHLDAEQIHHEARYALINNKRTQFQLQQIVRKQEEEINELEQKSARLQKFLKNMNKQVNLDASEYENLMTTLENSKKSCMELQKNSNVEEDFDIEELMNKYDVLLSIKNAKKTTHQK